MLQEDRTGEGHESGKDEPIQECAAIDSRTGQVTREFFRLTVLQNVKRKVVSSSSSISSGQDETTAIVANPGLRTVLKKGIKGTGNAASASTPTRTST